MRKTTVLIAATLLVTLSACSSAAEHPIGDFVGETLDEMAAVVPEETSIITQDASPRVDETPSFTELEFDSDLWTVIAACSTAATIEESDFVEVAVIPTASVTDEVRAAIDGGDWDDAVVCDNGRDFR